MALTRRLRRISISADLFAYLSDRFPINNFSHPVCSQILRFLPPLSLSLSLRGAHSECESISAHQDSAFRGKFGDSRIWRFAERPVDETANNFEFLPRGSPVVHVRRTGIRDAFNVVEKGIRWQLSWRERPARYSFRTTTRISSVDRERLSQDISNPPRISVRVRDEFWRVFSR